MSPASAPPREIPEGLDEQQIAFVDILDSIYMFFDDPETLQQQIRQILSILQESPEYIDMVRDEDIQTIFRAMKDVLGFARIKKAEKKRSGGSRSKSKAISDDDLDALDEIFGQVQANIENQGDS